MVNPRDKDGLYRVETNYFVAGFVVKDGKIVRMAPILRKNIQSWMKIAVWICE